jgi:hypothetical protein
MGLISMRSKIFLNKCRIDHYENNDIHNVRIDDYQYLRM